MILAVYHFVYQGMTIGLLSPPQKLGATEATLHHCILG